MAALNFYLSALVDEVRSIMAADGITTPSVIGVREKHALVAPPRYVWVPARSAERKTAPHRAVDQYRSLFSSAEHVFVHCWGRTYAEAWALRQNVLVAMQRAARADLSVISGQWARPGEAWNQAGELYSLEVSVDVPVPDHFVTIGQVGEAPTYEPQPTADITDSGWTLYSSPDTGTDGEEAIDENPPTP